MIEFKNIEELKESFLTGHVKFEDSLIVSETEYRKLRSTEHSLEKMLCEGYKALFIYSLRPNPENKEHEHQAGLHDWIIFMWGFNDQLRLVPYDVQSTTRARGSSPHLGEAFKEIDADRIIPDRVRVMICDVPVSKELVGKVDTGADICSLHAENIDVDKQNQKVSFDCSALSDNRFTVPLVDNQSVRVPSSEETVYRPVVSFNIKIAGKMLNGIKVNLNDRSNMDQPFLVGQNALEAGQFIIDPNLMKENLDVETLIQELSESSKDEEVKDQPTISDEDVAKMFDLFEGSQLTLDGLIKVLRTEAINRFKDVEF